VPGRVGQVGDVALDAAPPDSIREGLADDGVQIADRAFGQPAGGTQ
jgi:hypothetical protein